MSHEPQRRRAVRGAHLETAHSVEAIPPGTPTIDGDSVRDGQGTVNGAIPLVTGLVDVDLADKVSDEHVSTAAGWALQFATTGLPPGLALRLNVGGARGFPKQLPAEIAYWARGSRAIGIVGRDARTVAALMAAVAAALSDDPGPGAA